MLRIRCIGIGFLLLVSVCLICLAGCRQSDEPGQDAEVQDDASVTDAAELDDSVEAKFEKARITWTDEKGRPVWEAQFEEAVASQAGSDALVELHGVEASLYSDGEIASKLIAPRVEADSRTKEIRASGGVRISSALHDASARSDRLVWKSAEGKVHGTGGVRMIRSNLSITAASFETDTALSTARFRSASVSLGE